VDAVGLLASQENGIPVFPIRVRAIRFRYLLVGDGQAENGDIG
jgi:hypothetical protein